MFNKHLNDMGMELASKFDGKVKKETSPAGYSNYVGNERYGSWRTHSDGSRFWEFYGKYAFMSSMFNLATMPIRYSMWNDYHSNYRGHGRTYYGTGSYGRYYGSNSRYSNNVAKNRTWASKPKTYKEKLRAKVKQSASRAKISRSSNRVSSRSSYRSRSSGFGK
jgi:hypothetical protein